MRIIWGSLTLIGLWACGDDKRQESEQIVRRTYGIPLTYEIDDPACNSANAVADLGQRQVWRWDAEQKQAVPKTLDLSGFSGHGLTRRGVVKESWYGLAERVFFDCPTGVRSECRPRQRGEQLSAGKILNICHSGDFARDSVEAAALGTIAALQEAADFYAKIASEQTSALELFILPQVIRVYRRQDGNKIIEVTESLVNNAGWSLMQGQPSIIVFPHSQDLREAGVLQGMSFWEIPWVFAHEYGHQVFYELAPELSQQTIPALKSQSLADVLFYRPFQKDGMRQLHQETRSEPTASGSLASPDGRQRSLGAVIGTINEAFADLFAHYQADMNSDALHVFPCFFGRNRDPESSIFESDEAKILDAQTLERFFYRQFRGGGSCDGPVDFGDVHTMGAVMAHIVDQFFQSRGPTTDRLLLGRKLIAWGKLLNSMLGKLDLKRMPPAAPIAYALQAALLLEADQTGTIGTDLCQLVQEKAPFFADMVIQDAGDSPGRCKIVNGPQAEVSTD